MGDSGHGSRMGGSRARTNVDNPPPDGAADATGPTGGNNSTGRPQRQRQQQQQQQQQQPPAMSVVTTAAAAATVFDSSTGWIRVSGPPFGGFVPTPPVPPIQSPAPGSWTTLLTPAPSPTPPHAPVFLGYAPHLGWPPASAFQPLPYAAIQPFPWLPTTTYPASNPFPLETTVYDFSQPPPPPTPQFIMPFGVISPFGSMPAAPPTPVPTLIATTAVPPAPPPTPSGNVPILPRPDRETETPPERPPRCNVRPPGRTTPVTGRSRSPVTRGKKKTANNNNLLNGGLAQTSGSRKASGEASSSRQRAASSASSSSSSGPPRGRIISVGDPNLNAVSSSSSQMWGGTAAVVQPFGVVDQCAAPGQQGQQQHSHHTQVQQQQMQDQQYQQQTRHRVPASGRSGVSGRAGISQSFVGGGGGEDDGPCDNLFLGSSISSVAKTNVSFSSSPLLSLLLDSVIDSGTFDEPVVGESGIGGEDAKRDGRGGGGGGNVGLGGDDNITAAPPLLGGVVGEVVGVESEPSGSSLRVVGGDDAPSSVPSSVPFDESSGFARSRSSTIASDSTTTTASESKWALRSCGSLEGEPSSDQKRSGIERASPGRVGFRPIGATPSDASSLETTPERRARRTRMLSDSRREPSSSDSSRERPADDTADIPSLGSRSVSGTSVPSRDGSGGSFATGTPPTTRLRRSLPPSSRSNSTTSNGQTTQTSTTPSNSPTPKRSRVRRTTAAPTFDTIVPAPISRRRQSVDGRPSAAAPKIPNRVAGNPRPAENGVITRDRAKRDAHPPSKPLRTSPRKKKPPRSPEAQQQNDDDEGIQKKHKDRSSSKGNERAGSPAAVTPEDESKDARGPGFVQRNLRRVASRVAREAAKRPLLSTSPPRSSTPHQQLANPTAATTNNNNNNSLSRLHPEETELGGGSDAVVSAAPDTTSGGEEEVDEIEAAEALSDALAMLKGPGGEDDPLGDAVVPDGMTGVARVVEVMSDGVCERVSDYDVQYFAEMLNDDIGEPLWWDD
ncbi:m18 protein [Murid betaherpesvirus 1]|nr:m18 protein [Murid betaherpesvirus 1]